MSTLHLPERLVNFSQSFKATDPSARVVGAIAIVTFVALLVAIYLR